MKYLYPIFITLFAASTLQAGATLTFNVTKESEIPKDDKVSKEKKQYALKVYLGKSVIDEQSQGYVCIRDFKNKKIYRLGKGRTGVAAVSLFSDIGFRVYEFENRMMLGRALGAADMKDNPMDPGFVEHSFSLTSDKKTRIERRTEKNAVVFKYKNKPLFRYSLKSIPIAETGKERFVLLLRYRYGIHPQILSELAKTSGVPKEIIVHKYNVGTEKINLKLLAVDNSKDPPKRELTPLVMPGNGLIYKLIKKVENTTKEDYSKACSNTKKKAIENAKAGNNLDAVSLFVGYTLATGKQMPPEFFKYKDAIMKDRDVRLLLSSISPKSKEAAERALDDLKKLSEKSKDGTCTILIFRANILTSLKKRSEAIESFLAALSKDPMIAGAWKDLGDIYFSNYDSETAWLCWDAGRSLNPRHRLFEHVNQFERKLQANHPEFFIKGLEPKDALDKK